MDIIQLLKQTVASEPDMLVLAGVCIPAGGSLVVHPIPDDVTVAFVVDTKHIVLGPIDFESNTSPYNRADYKAVKVRRGTKIVMRYDGKEQHVELTPEPDRDGPLFALASTARRKTFCIGFLEFECGSGQFIGPCIFGWGC